MKKIICLLAGLMLMGTVFCQENANEKNEDVKPQIEFLINQNLKNNMDTISVLSLQLPASDKMNLYNKYKKDALKPVLLNSLVGFGVGSYLDGDLLGGIVGSALDGVGLLFLTMALMDYADDLSKYQRDINNAANRYRAVASSYDYDLNIRSVEAPVTIRDAPDFLFGNGGIIAFCVIIGARVYEGTRANRYVKKYNKRLVEALNLNSLSTSFVPVLKQDGSLAMSFNVQMTF